MSRFNPTPTSSDDAGGADNASPAGAVPFAKARPAGKSSSPPDKHAADLARLSARGAGLVSLRARLEKTRDLAIVEAYDLVRKRGIVSNADAARALGMSAPSMHQALNRHAKDIRDETRRLYLARLVSEDRRKPDTGKTAFKSRRRQHR